MWDMGTLPSSFCLLPLRAPKRRDQARCRGAAWSHRGAPRQNRVAQASHAERFRRWHLVKGAGGKFRNFQAEGRTKEALLSARGR